MTAYWFWVNYRLPLHNNTGMVTCSFRKTTPSFLFKQQATVIPCFHSIYMMAYSAPPSVLCLNLS
uniref:Uncharacterized protein n=1 Tax=Anguilla anguilla TaxID=7936 RepID=A0A0E9WUW2_ANGAN